MKIGVSPLGLSPLTHRQKKVAPLCSAKVQLFEGICKFLKLIICN